ncbi:PREDICTED: DNA helicase B [Chrysochloris asiatica]|uniref:DNA helicase B n=1 Tax=Chrysochloris asiatica TaxID=185453 RepID=A0A9B0T706_CHRAS|nr:PREDICTED: DNA helicase B [Chrysochloris asiatica]
MACLDGNLRELRGVLCPAKDPVEKDNDCLKEDVEEDEDPVFVDAEELCSGGVKAGCLPGRLRVSICDENTQEIFEVFGRFPLIGPWWQVRVQAKPVGRSYYTQGFPSYFLQSDMSPPNQQQICSLFLTECQVSDEFKTLFLKWVNEVSSYEDLNFENIRETLRTFQRESERKNKKKSAQNKQEETLSDCEMSLPLEHTIPFKNVMTALQFPKIMEFLPILLPRHFKQLINSDSTVQLEKIEEILSEYPWKLGFSKITYRELKLVRCEASWTAFNQCQPLLQSMTDLEKNALMIYSKLKQICREHGHTCIEEVELTSALSHHMSFNDTWHSLKFLKDIGVVTYEKSWIFLYDLYQAEQTIASSICQLMRGPPWHLRVDVRKVLASLRAPKPEDSESGDILHESVIPDERRLENSLHIVDTQENRDHNGANELNAETDDVQLDRDQVTALEMICSNAVTVISGKGGCGKTTIVSHLFKHIQQLEEKEVKKACEDFERDQDLSEEWQSFTEQNQVEAGKAIEVLLTAPTGKAASLLRHKTGLHAYTLCQVNYSFYLWEKHKMAKEKPWKFSSVRVLVVDEGSLVSVGIFKSVLNLLCEHSKLSKLIVLGDIRQLPSIEPGNLLNDLFETLKSRKCAVELRTNHRTESQLIVDNATRISRHQFPVFDAELKISDNSILPMSIEDKAFIFVRLPEENAGSQKSQLSKSNHHPHLYSVVGALLKEKDLKDEKKSQFIAFRRQDCDLINDCCSKHYRGHLIKDHANRLVFRIGDKICCTKNAYLSDLLPESASESQYKNALESNGGNFDGLPQDFAKNKNNFESDIRLCNGEIFYITGDNTDVTFGTKRSLTIDNYAGLEVTVDFGKLMQYCRIKHAWARTIHTFQGSEEQTVVYVVGKAGRQHWQHVYTAVTRGRSRVYIIAEESQLRSAIKRSNIPRKTRLKHFLQNCLLSTSCASPPQSPSQSSGQSGEACTQPSASPLTTAGTDSGMEAVPKSRASMPNGSVFAFAERRLSSSEVDADENLSKTPGFKRTYGVNVDESPSKVRMVEESSPQVSSRFQNMKLNNLSPRQLFKSTDNQES